MIIIIGLLVVGGGGYFVWTNYFNEPEPISVQPDNTVPEPENPEEENSEDTATTPTTPETTTPITVDDDMYHITQWGLKGDYNGSYSVQYEVTETDRVVFKSKDFASDTGKQCQIASILRQTSINENPVYSYRN